MASKVGRRTLTSLFKQGDIKLFPEAASIADNSLFLGWDEIPEVIGSGGLALVGIGLGVFGCWRYYANDGDNRRYKNEYVVYRDTDPRAKLVRQD